MLRRFILFILLNLLVFQTQAQQMIWASYDKFSGANNHCNTIGEFDEGLYMLRYKDKNLKKNVYIDFYDHNLRLIETTQVGERKMGLEKIMLLEANLHLIYGGNGYSNKTLYKKLLIPLDKEANKIEPVAWLDINTEMGNSTYFDIDYNDARTKGAVNYIEKKGEIGVYNCHFFDANLKITKVATYPFDIESKNVRILSKVIDKHGNLYMAYRKITKSGFFGRDESDVYLLTYNFKENQWNSVLLTDNEFYISTLMIKENAVNDLIHLSFFYSLKLENGNYGLQNMIFSSTNQSLQNRYRKKLDEELTRTITGDKLGKEQELNSFFIRDIIPTSDSGSLVIAERYFVSSQTETYYQNGLPVTASRNVYNFEEVLILSNDFDCKPKWNKTLLKRQNSVTDGGYFSSIVVIPAPDKVHIIYNEKLLNNGDVIQYSIDKEGHSSQKNLFRNDMAAYMIIPSESRNIGYNRAAIPLYISGGDRGLLKIVY